MLPKIVGSISRRHPAKDIGRRKAGVIEKVRNVVVRYIKISETMKQVGPALVPPVISNCVTFPGRLFGRLTLVFNPEDVIGTGGDCASTAGHAVAITRARTMDSAVRP